MLIITAPMIDHGAGHVLLKSFFCQVWWSLQNAQMQTPATVLFLIPRAPIPLCGIPWFPCHPLWAVFSRLPDHTSSAVSVTDTHGIADTHMWLYFPDRWTSWHTYSKGFFISLFGDHALGLLLAILRRVMWCWGWAPGLLHTKQSMCSSPLNHLSGPQGELFFFFLFWHCFGKGSVVRNYTWRCLGTL